MTKNLLGQNKQKEKKQPLIKFLKMKTSEINLPNNLKNKVKEDRGTEGKQLHVYTKEEIEYMRKLYEEIQVSLAEVREQIRLQKENK